MSDEQPNIAGDTENSFLARARYGKGKRTLQAILDATYELITTEGLTATSQEAIARRANVSQSAVRHYFPTKDELLAAFFSVGIERLESAYRARLAEPDSDPRKQLIELACLQFERMEETKDVYFYEASAYFARNPAQDVRTDWYQFARQAYLELIRRIHPEWDEDRCIDTSFQVYTLILGGWITMGESLPFRQHRSFRGLRGILIDGIERLIDSDNRDS